jgi:hypothetical protein
MTTTAPNEVEAYLAELRVHLSALPEPERTDVLADLAAHLNEVAAEADAPLASVVGPPAAYAQELLASAQPRVPAQQRRRLAVLADSARAWPGWTRVAATADGIRPAWWVARAYVATIAVAGASGTGTLDTFPLPTVLQSVALGCAVLAAAIVLSVAIGLRTAGRARLLSVLPDLALVVVAVAVGLRVHDALTRVRYPHVAPAPPFLNDNGNPIQNIFPYALDGTPLHGVLLYDQDGNPLTNVYIGGYAPDGNTRVPLTYPRDAAGAPIRNAFPLSEREAWYTRTGRARTKLIPPPIVALPRVSKPAPAPAKHYRKKGR